MTKLSGNIKLIRSDFKFQGTFYPDDNFKLVVTKIRNGIIDNNLIEFEMVPYDSNGEELHYIVNLTRKETGTFYNGNAKLLSYPDHKAEIECQLFMNNESKEFVILGTWQEMEEDLNGFYTFIAKINKPETHV